MHIKIQHTDVYFKPKPLKSCGWLLPHLFRLIPGLQKEKSPTPRKKGGFSNSFPFLPPFFYTQPSNAAFQQFFFNVSSKLFLKNNSESISCLKTVTFFCYVKHGIHYAAFCSVFACLCRTVSMWIKCRWLNNIKFDPVRNRKGDKSCLPEPSSEMSPIIFLL